MSDLHLETKGLDRPQAEDADLVVLAGDIDNGVFGIRWALEHFSVPVIYVPGNHEFYDASRTELLVKMRKLCKGSHVHLLEQDSLTIGKLRFLGTTLWTDFALDGNQRHSMNIAQRYMMDFRCIEVCRGEPFTCQRALELHQRSLAWLRKQLRQTGDTTTVVISHHAPSPRSIASQYQGNALNPAFVTNLEALILEHDIALWIHGHTHTAFDYNIGNTRVVCNPRGYLPYESDTGFQAGMLLDLGADSDQ
jgi:predicted phosphodiesterase